MVFEGRKEMLDQNDKKWVEDLLDRKLDETKSDLRGEMQEMKTELRDEMQEMKTELRDEMQEMKGDIISQVTAVFENTYEDYIKLISEIVPDKVRSYDRVEEEQYRQQGEINLFKGIAADHEKRIVKLEAAQAHEG